MTLLWSAIAVALVLATGSWLLGRRKRDLNDPYEISNLLTAAVWVLIGSVQVYTQWREIGEVIVALRSPNLVDLAPNADKIEFARAWLVLCSGLLSLFIVNFVRAARTTIKAVKGRAPSAAKTQEQTI